jgi:hypothetical protein
MPDMSYPCDKLIGDTDKRCTRIHTHKGECCHGPKPFGGVQITGGKNESTCVLVTGGVEDAKQIIKNSRKGSVANH